MACKLVCVCLTAVAVSFFSFFARRPLSGFIGALWPIRRDELDRVVLLSAALFLTAFNYHALKASKDTLVVTYSGASSIPFIKAWALLPITCLVSYCYAHASIRLGTKITFFLLLSFFLGFFGIFGLLIYPNREMFFLNRLADCLAATLPKGLYTITTLIRNWPFTLFYVMSELWGAIVLNVCFWGFANEITSSEEAKRFYPILRTCLNLAGVFSGTVGVHLASASFDPLFPIGKTAWDQAIVKTMFIVVCSGLGVLSLFYYITNHLPHKRTRDLGSETMAQRKENHSFLGHGGIKWLWNSPQILYLSCAAFSFSFILNTTEVLWKIQLHKLYPNPCDFASYTYKISIITSIMAAFSAFFLSREFLSSKRWMVLATPLIASITTIGFFGFLFLPEWATKLATPFGLSLLGITVLFGSAQTCLVRASKSALMDITKDLALIEEKDKKSRIKGKAFIDGIASRSGKTFASLLLSFIFAWLGSIEQSFATIAMIDAFILITWMRSTLSMEKKVNKNTPKENLTT